MKSKAVIEASTKDQPDNDDYKNKLWGIIFKILISLVIPLVIWGVKLEVNNEVLRERVTQTKEQLTQRIEQCSQNVKSRNLEISKIRETVKNNYGQLVGLSVKLNTANEQLKSLNTLITQIKTKR